MLQTKSLFNSMIKKQLILPLVGAPLILRIIKKSPKLLEDPLNRYLMNHLDVVAQGINALGKVDKLQAEAIEQSDVNY